MSAKTGRKRVRLHQEHAEHAGLLRVITAAMAWTAGIALGLATGDLLIALVLTVVITSGHLVSWRTRLWRSARWQIMLLVPTSMVALLLVPSLPQAFQGDWLHPMRYLLLLQALTSFYLHSRASLYTAQVLSGIVLLVSSQLAFDSAFLVFFFAFFLLMLVFLAAAARTDAVRDAIGVGRWQSAVGRYAWGGAGAIAVLVASLGAFLLAPWGSLSVAGSGSMLPLTGQVSDAGGAEGPAQVLPLTGGADPAQQPEPPQPAQGEGQGGGAAPGAGVGGEQGIGGAPSTGGAMSPDFATAEGWDGTVPGDPGPGGGAPNPTVMQVRSPVATYWRGQTYTFFDGAQWTPDSTVRFAGQTRSSKRQYTQTFFVKDDLATPVFGYTALGWQPLGEATAMTLSEGDVYRVVSERRNFHPAALARADGANVINRGGDNGIPQRVRDLARDITLGKTDALSKALAITQYLRAYYTFVHAVDQYAPLQTVEQFLFGEARMGNAYDFASAQTALAVAAGLEARMVTGFLPGELDPLSGTYVVRASDAHAWTEINFRDGIGWVPFDGNPREDGQATTAAARSGAAGVLSSLFNQRVGDQVRAAIKVTLEELVEIAGRALVPVAAGVVVVGAAFFARVVLRRRKRVEPYSLLNDRRRRELLKAYARSMRQVRKRVQPRTPDETLDQYFARLAREHPSSWSELLWLRDKLNQAAYSPVAVTDEELAEARAVLTKVRRTVMSGV